MGVKFDRVRVAKILVERFLTNDDNLVCDKYDITTRTLRNYAIRLKTDNELSENFRKLLDKVMSNWIEKAKSCLETQIQTIDSLAQVAKDANDYKVISEVADSLKVVGDLVITVEALSATENQDVS